MENPASRDGAAKIPPSRASARPPLREAGAPHEPSLIAKFERLIGSFKRTSSNYATLVVLDLRRAAVQFAWVIAGGILISVLVVTAWLAGVVALASWLLRDGMPLPVVLIVAAGVNLAGALLVGLRLRSLVGHVPFAATLRQIKSDEPTAHSEEGKGDVT